MKPGYLAVLAAASLATAQPHNHHAHNHRHLHAKRDARLHQHAQAAKRDAPSGSTVWVCQLADRLLSEEECQQGILNGTLVSPDGPLTQEAPPPPPTTSSSPPPPPSSTSTSSPAAQTNTPSNPGANAKQAVQSNNGGGSSGGQGVGSDFPDGEIDCSDFPDEYGAQKVPWLALGGWTGVQCPGDSSGGFSNIITALMGQTCHEGCYCSYACPAGYQKVQWPDLQGATGQSVGGLQCKNGKLHLTNSAHQTLCGQGSQQVQVQVVNNLGSNSAVCRTDYPGTESETVPLDTQPGGSYPLTCPDSDNYYHWQGAQTSAQYYVNNQGVSVEDACVWNTAGSNSGNWAPVNLGASFSNGAAWLSILANKPTNPNAKLDFTITLQGDKMSGKCQYKNGQYCSGDNYDNCNSDGCTVSVPSGQASYVFSN